MAKLLIMNEVELTSEQFEILENLSEQTGKRCHTLVSEAVKPIIEMSLDDMLNVQSGLELLLKYNT